MAKPQTFMGRVAKETPLAKRLIGLGGDLSAKTREEKTFGVLSNATLVETVPILVECMACERYLAISEAVFCNSCLGDETYG